MSRSSYSDDLDDNWALIRWRGAVAAAIKGRRGQSFLREMLAALDALPAPRLIPNQLTDGDDVCALGSVGMARQIDMENLDPDDYDKLSAAFGIPVALVREIEFVNDDPWYGLTPEQRFQRVREWVIEQLRSPKAATA